MKREGDGRMGKEARHFGGWTNLKMSGGVAT